MPRDTVEMPSSSWHFRSWQDIKDTSLFTKSNYINIIMLIIFVAIAIRQAKGNYEKSKKAGHERRFMAAPDFPNIEEQTEFDWEKTEPLELRPFKPKYHLTMAHDDSSALENLSPSSLIVMDKNYASRLTARKSIMAKHPDDTHSVSNDKLISPAVREYYTFLLGTYLPLRFPRMFTLHSHTYEQGQTFMLQSQITKEMHPAFPIHSTTPTTTLLQVLGRTLDEDILFLAPEDPSSPATTKYILQAYICCCPSGFSPHSKLGKRLAEIHEPVPGYASKLESSMDKYFAKLEVGKYVKRSNWSIATTSDLYTAPSPDGKNNMHAHSKSDSEPPLSSIDPENTFLRCERQTLHRLPASKAIVFSFKTYLYPLSEIKKEEDGKVAEELAEAIDGLKEGNVDGMHFYKRGAVWGEAVKKYLRS